jgi:hypothetical protein
VSHFHKVERSVVICWVPGNDAADVPAKSAALHGALVSNKSLALIFASSPSALFDPCGIASGPVHRTTNCQW